MSNLYTNDLRTDRPYNSVLSTGASTRFQLWLVERRELYSLSVLRSFVYRFDTILLSDSCFFWCSLNTTKCVFFYCAAPMNDRPKCQPSDHLKLDQLGMVIQWFGSIVVGCWQQSLLVVMERQFRKKSLQKFGKKRCQKRRRSKKFFFQFCST